MEHLNVLFDVRLDILEQEHLNLMKILDSKVCYSVVTRDNETWTVSVLLSRNGNVKLLIMGNCCFEKQRLM